MKKLGLLVSFLSFGFVLYCLGYYRGVNDASFLLSTTRALIETGTINYIDQGKYENAKQMNLSDLESSIAAMEDITSLNGKLTIIPAVQHIFCKFTQAICFENDQACKLR